MPKKFDLTLDDLKVQSFVTSVAQDQQKALQGGHTGETQAFACCPPTNTQAFVCCPPTNTEAFVCCA